MHVSDVGNDGVEGAVSAYSVVLNLHAHHEPFQKKGEK